MMQAHTQLNRGILFITVSNDTITPAIKQEMAAIADMVCDFKVRTVGSDFETSMIVSKFRNAPENLSIMVYRVTPEEGITPETVERIASEVEGEITDGDTVEFEIGEGPKGPNAVNVRKVE